MVATLITLVAFPAHKPYYFEEFDWQAGPHAPYFMYHFARPAKVMFDGIS